MKVTMTFAALCCFMLGCAHGATHRTEVAGLEAQVETLRGEAASLRADKSDLCRLAAEVGAGGVMVYVGDDKWFNGMTGAVEPIAGIDAKCDEVLESFRSSIESGPRADARAEYEATQPPVSE